jgi:hypothetical protein
MDGELDAGDLAGRWSLDLDALTWIETKAPARRLGLAAQLRHDALTGRFAETAEEIPTAAARHLADQLDRPVADLAAYTWTGREPRCATASGSCAFWRSGRRRRATSTRCRPGSKPKSAPGAGTSTP